MYGLDFEIKTTEFLKFQVKPGKWRVIASYQLEKRMT